MRISPLPCVLTRIYDIESSHNNSISLAIPEWEELPLGHAGGFEEMLL